MEGNKLVILVAILILVVLFLASPRGKAFLEQTKLKDKIGILGDFLKNLTGRITMQDKKQTSKIEFHLSGVDPVYMNNQQFSLKDSSVDAILGLQSGSLSGFTISFKNKANIEIKSITGDFSINDGQIKISGKTNEIWVGDLGLNGTDTEVLLIGNPVEYSIKNIEKNTLVLQEISGKISWTGIKVPPILNKDKLEVYGFEGSIQQKDGLIFIDGYVDYIKLNNIPIGAFG